MAAPFVEKYEWHQYNHRQRLTWTRTLKLMCVSALCK